MNALDFLVSKDRLGCDPPMRELRPVRLLRGRPAAHREVRADGQQHHLCRIWQGNELLGLLSRGNRLGAASRSGDSPRCRIALPGYCRWRALLWLLPDVFRSDPATRALRPRLDLPKAPTHRSAARGVQQLFALQRRSLPCAGTEDAEAILRPLFMTSWLIDDFLADNELFRRRLGGHRADHALQRIEQDRLRHGVLPCPARRDGRRPDLGRQPRFLPQPRLLPPGSDLRPTRPTRCRPGCRVCRLCRQRGTAPRHSHPAPKLKYSCAVGGTHVDQLGGAHDLPGPRPTLFFAPAQIKKRSAEWGAALLGQRLLESWQDFLGSACDARNPWLQISRHRGRQSVAEAYRLVLSGRDEPRLGRILSLQED
jgi:hypothetical protein